MSSQSHWATPLHQRCLPPGLGTRKQMPMHKRQIRSHRRRPNRKATSRNRISLVDTGPRALERTESHARIHILKKPRRAMLKKHASCSSKAIANSVTNADIVTQNLQMQILQLRRSRKQSNRLRKSRKERLKQSRECVPESHGNASRPTASEFQLQP